jgi:hypothetical protein
VERVVCFVNCLEEVMGFLMKTEGLFVESKPCKNNSDYYNLHFKVTEDNNGTVSVLENMRRANALFLVTRQDVETLYYLLQTGQKYQLDVEVYSKPARGNYPAGLGMNLIKVHGLLQRQPQAQAS